MSWRHLAQPSTGADRRPGWANTSTGPGVRLLRHSAPSRLIYETAAVLSVWTSTCLPNSGGRNCRKAKCTAHSSRQLMCQSSRSPVQSPEAACPLHVAPQPVLEASVVTTVCRDTCSRGTPARRELALFPVDPKPQLELDLPRLVPEHQVPVIAQLLSGLG